MLTNLKSPITFSGAKVVELNATVPEEVLVSSGFGDSSISPEPTSSPPVIEEKPGQLYAYRLSRSEVTLGTRRRDVLGASVGAELVAIGTYVCVANNAVINNTVMIILQVKGTFLVFLFASYTYLV